jgi:YebC/PmpR family DNA-binding regulatory protein
MSGHSKWSSIKHQKAASDAKKGAVFTRMARAVSIAAREGGGDVETNFKLRMAIDQAKTFNVPKENIERAIKRGTGESSEGQLQETIYEGYGPGGVAIIIKVVTDNTNRAVSDIRHVLSKHGGSLGESGSVMWNFELKGVVRFRAEGIERDAIELAAIDAGAEDIKEEEESLMITTDTKNVQALKEALESKDVIVEFAEIEYIPKNTVDIDGSVKKKLDALTNALEELEDVNDFYTNDSSP